LGLLQAQSPSTTLKLDGLEIEFDAAGDWTRMYSTYRQPVSFPDRTGIRKAYTIAEEKGKAQIIRFMQENVATDRLVAEVNTEIQQAERSISGEKETVSKTTKRHMLESVTEFTRSYSSGMLRGITVLEQGYDEKAEEVWVKIGLSRKTAALGQRLQNDLANPTSRDSARANDAAATAGTRKLFQSGELQTRKPPFDHD